MTRKKEKEQTADVFDESTHDDDLANESEAVRKVTITHTPKGKEGVHEEISIEGYPPRAVATLLTDMTSAFVAILCKHVPDGTAKLALLRTFIPAAMAEIDRFEKKHGIKGSEMDNMVGKLMQLVMSKGQRDQKGEEDEDSTSNEG